MYAKEEKRVGTSFSCTEGKISFQGTYVHKNKFQYWFILVGKNFECPWCPNIMMSIRWYILGVPEIKKSQDLKLLDFRAARHSSLYLIFENQVGKIKFDELDF